MTPSGDLLAEISRYAVVKSVHPARSAAGGAPVVINIQDVHGQSEAQKNIAETILAVLRREPRAIVGLEGMAGAIPLEKFRPSTPLINREVASFFLNTGLITGGEFAGIAAPKTPFFYGIEDPSLYRKNVAAVRAALSSRESNLTTINRLARDLQKRKEAIYTPELLALDQLWRGYHEETVPLGDYLEALQKIHPEMDPAMELFRETWALEKSLDFDRAERERNQVLTRLTDTLAKPTLDALLQDTLALRGGTLAYPDYYRRLKAVAKTAGLDLALTPEFDRYVGYILMSDAIRPEALLAGVASLEKLTWADLCKTPEQFDLVTEANRLELRRKMVRLSLTPAEWAELRASSESGAFPAARAFYRHAEARNAALARNFRRRLQASPARLGVLVAGGFHSEGLNALLSDGSVTVVTVAPRMKGAIAGSDAYLDVFTRERTPLEKIFEAPAISIVMSGATHSLTDPSGRPYNGSTGLVESLVKPLATVLRQAEKNLPSVFQSDLVVVAATPRGSVTMPAGTANAMLEATTEKGTGVRVWATEKGLAMSRSDILWAPLREWWMPVVALAPAVFAVLPFHDQLSFRSPLTAELAVQIGGLGFTAAVGGVALAVIAAHLWHRSTHNPEGRREVRVATLVVSALSITAFFAIYAALMHDLRGDVALTRGFVAGAGVFTALHWIRNFASVLDPSIAPMAGTGESSDDIPLTRFLPTTGPAFRERTPPPDADWVVVNDDGVEYPIAYGEPILEEGRTLYPVRILAADGHVIATRLYDDAHKAAALVPTAWVRGIASADQAAYDAFPRSINHSPMATGLKGYVWSMTQAVVDGAVVYRRTLFRIAKIGGPVEIARLEGPSFRDLLFAPVSREVMIVDQNEFQEFRTKQRAVARNQWMVRMLNRDVDEIKEQNRLNPTDPRVAAHLAELDAVVRDHNQRIYSEIFSDTFLQTRGTTVLADDHQSLLELADEMKRRGVRSILDIGAGPGLWTATLSEQSPDFSIDVAEPATSFLPVLRARQAEGQIQRIFETDMTDLAGVPGAHYDAVVFQASLLHVLNAPGVGAELALRRARATLKAGGFLYLFVRMGDNKEELWTDEAGRLFQHHTEASLRALVTGAGFEVEQLVVRKRISDSPRWLLLYAKKTAPVDVTLRDATRESDQAMSGLASDRVVDLVAASQPVQRNVVKTMLNFKGARGVLDRRLAAQLEFAREARAEVDGPMVRPLVANAANLAGRSGIAWSDARALLVEELRALEAGPLTIRFFWAWAKGRTFGVIVRSIAWAEPVMAFIRSVQLWNSTQVMLLQADDIFGSDDLADDQRKLAIDPIFERVRKARAKGEPVVFAAHYRPEAGDLGTQQISFIRRLDAEFAARGLGSMKFTVVLVPEGLIEPSEALRQARLYNPALRGRKVWLNIYTAHPEQFDLNDRAARFMLFALDGTRVIPVSIQVIRARVYAINA